MYVYFKMFHMPKKYFLQYVASYGQESFSCLLFVFLMVRLWEVFWARKASHRVEKFAFKLAVKLSSKMGNAPSCVDTICPLRMYRSTVADNEQSDFH